MIEKTKDLISKYLQNVASKFEHKETSEMGYRTDFETLLKGIFESIKVRDIQHDPKAKQGNKPDFVVINNSVPILYIEVKDIGVPLDKVEKSAQMARYFGYTNLVLTDYLEFRFYRNGVSYEEPIKIAEYDLKTRSITPLSENYDRIAKTLIDFTQSQKEPIKSGEHLAKIMGGKAQRIRDNIKQYLATDSKQNAGLSRIYETIKKLLVHDLTLDAFADMYAQTLVYGLFVARYYDETPETFSRQEARDLVPASNPFLRHFFDHITGTDYDTRLGYIVDELCIVFQHSNVLDLMRQYYKIDLWGKTHENPDPVIHFYEDFLKEYDPELRKKMGAYYTPLPVVNFIVRSVDHILQKEFGLPNGLADTSKLPTGKHRVQILDPAVGTGTFISAVVSSIYEHLVKQGQKGRWPTYVHNDLLPRLHGFELMMTPYTIAHLKLSMLFKEKGFWIFNRRLGIYLTNSLEQSEAQQSIFSFGLAESIAEEAKEAGKIKNDTPIMIVIGNPPYSGVSSNDTEYANSLVTKYKVEPGGKIKLQERKHWLNDDYVKFIAFAEDMVVKNCEGVLGFITNNGYLDNPTFRGMRWHLLDAFDLIYIIDLHGNSKKQEVSPDGSKDENIFAIQQGVSILLAIKTGEKKEDALAKVYRTDIWGRRESKFDQLDNLSIENSKWASFEPRLPNLFFLMEGPLKRNDKYQEGFAVDELFNVKGVGVVTARDELTIDIDKANLWKRVASFSSLPVEETRSKFDLGKDVQSWKVSWAQEDVKKSGPDIDLIKFISYRPFDVRYCYYTGKSSGFMARPGSKVMNNFIYGENIGLVMVKQFKTGNLYHHVFVSKNITESTLVSNRTSEIGYSFPIYLNAQDGSKALNLKTEIVKEINNIVGKTTPENIFDYIYAVLHSPSYRDKYKEFLKIDFPRVPYPKDAKTFRKLVKLGTELRKIHLLESPIVDKYITTYPIEGEDNVEKIVFKDGKVFINEKQYFGKVPGIAWDFYIGGYQPAQKWLKDRKGRKLTNEDIEHYQKIIVALTETDRIMKEIDEINFLEK